MSYPTPNGEAQADLPERFERRLDRTIRRPRPNLVNGCWLTLRFFRMCSPGLSGELPVTLVLVIDQAEEMFTLARSPAEEWARGRVLEMIRQIGDRQGDFKLIVSLRTEYYGRLASALRRGPSDADGRAANTCSPTSTCPAMVAVISRPTSREHLADAREIPFERYRGFSFAETFRKPSPARLPRTAARTASPCSCR